MSALLTLAAEVAMLVLALAWVAAFVRLVRGPSLADRAVALDLMATLVIVLAAAGAIAFDDPVLVDVAIVLALVAFVGTVAFGLYLERAARKEAE